MMKEKYMLGKTKKPDDPLGQSGGIFITLQI